MSSFRHSTDQSTRSIRRDLAEIDESIRQSKRLVRETHEALHRSDALLAGAGNTRLGAPMIPVARAVQVDQPENGAPAPVRSGEAPPRLDRATGAERVAEDLDRIGARGLPGRGGAD